MNKKIISISLFFALVLPIVLFFTWIQVQKILVCKEVKQLMIAKIDRNELVLLKFSINQKSSLNNDKEFEYQGQMYDVVEKQIVSDSIYYWCWLDNKETALNQQLDELVQYTLNNHSQKNEQNKQIVHFYKSLFCEQIIHCWLFQEVTINQLFFRYDVEYQPSFFISFLTPPPEGNYSI